MSEDDIPEFPETEMMPNIIVPPRDSKALSHIFSVPVIERSFDSVFEEGFQDRLCKSCQFEKQVFTSAVDFDDFDENDMFEDQYEESSTPFNSFEGFADCEENTFQGFPQIQENPNFLFTSTSFFFE